MNRSTLLRLAAATAATLAASSPAVDWERLAGGSTAALDRTVLDDYTAAADALWLQLTATGTT